MTNVELIINAGTLVTVDQQNRVLDDHSLVINNGRILDLLPTSEAANQYSAARVEERPDHIVMPGLINTHTHLAMNLFRGLADDLPLMTWLQEHIWPAEGRWVDEQFVRDGTELALAESLLGGVTCVNDMYFYPDVVGTAASLAGIRATVGLIVLDFPTVWATDADNYITKGLALHDQLRTDSLVNTAFAPHAPYTVSAEPLIRIATLADELEIPVHMHVHETAGEVESFVEQKGQRPLTALDELGLLTPSMLAVHMTQLTGDEIERCAAAGVHILHCPESNMKLASGACPVTELLGAGVNVALGTDGAASNNDLDMFGEMRSAALLAKHHSADASAVPAESAIRMATINGAKALGLDKETGSLEIGKSADCITVNTRSTSMVPLYSPVSHLVYCTDRNQVDDVWVAGRQLVDQRALLTLDAEAIVKKSQSWSRRISSSSDPG
ncbi:MAG: TRZ/ATZ family hydrolase [Gammaproteobacteria bacterium]|nr:TRZ/ATZ family hydrolase [Gammaproteobacteria bacterium]